MRPYRIIGVLLVLSAAGCGGSDGAPPARPSATAVSPPPASVATTPGPPPASVATTPSPPPKPAFPRAADGKNVRACRDGRCEILVTKRTRIPLDKRFGFRSFTFDPADSTWRFGYADGGTGSVKFLEPPYTGQWAAPSGEAGLILTVVASEKSRTVISLSPSG